MPPAQPTSTLFPYTTLFRSRLQVGVDRDELDALQRRRDHPVDGVAAASAGAHDLDPRPAVLAIALDRKSTRLNSSHMSISYAVFCLKKKIATHLPPPCPCVY